jgi:hypothetical protein
MANGGEVRKSAKKVNSLNVGWSCGKTNFRIEHHGSIYLIVPLCASARDWLDEHIGKDNGFQMYWPTAIVEPRYLDEIIAGIRRDGLVAR